MVRFRDGEPSGIYYSQHRDGAAYEWDDDGLSLRDGRVCATIFVTSADKFCRVLG